MTEDEEKDQSVEDSHSPIGDPPSHIDAQREEDAVPSLQNPASDQPENAPEDFQPQPPLKSGQSEGIEERPGEQVGDVEEETNDQFESTAEHNDDEAIDDPESGEPG